MTKTHDLVSPVARLTVFVTDMDRSLEFYRDTLGFTQVDDKTVSGPMVGGLVGLESCTMRIVYLQSEGNDFGMVGLFEISDPPLPDGPKPPPHFYRGQAAAAFCTEDAELLQKRLDEFGVNYLLQPTAYSNPELGAFVELIVQDPDGIPVSFVQFTPLRPTQSRTWYRDI
jgi:catechol 2,3-dioxygenase-like lactoylglutathione lyase family enzyme